MHSKANPVKFAQAQYDSNTRNLLLLDVAGQPVSLRDAGPDGFNVVELTELLGPDIVEQLLASPAAPDSGWEYELRGQFHLWHPTSGEVLAILSDPPGSESNIVARAYTDPLCSQVLVDVHTRNSASVAEVLSIRIRSDDSGLPVVLVSDAHGPLVPVAKLTSSGKLAIPPGITDHDAPSEDQLLELLTDHFEQVGSDMYDSLKVISKALAKTPTHALASVLALSGKDRF